MSYFPDKKYQDIKLPYYWQKAHLQHLFGLSRITQTRTKNLFSLPLEKLKSKRRFTSPLVLTSGNLGGAAIMQQLLHLVCNQPNCDSMPNIACVIICVCSCYMCSNQPHIALNFQLLPSCSTQPGIWCCMCRYCYTVTNHVQNYTQSNLIQLWPGRQRPLFCSCPCSL